MSRVETIEYYESCPSCGGVSDGTGVCPYCGSSLVKNRIIREIDRSLEDQILVEDIGLPVVQGKCGAMSSFTKVFCSIFGGLFIIVPTIQFIAFATTGIMHLWLLLFFGLFWAIGAGSFVPLFKASKRNKSCKNGSRVLGIVRGYTNSNTSINGQPTKVVRLRIDEGGSRLVLFDTGNTQRLYPVGSTVVVRTDGESYLIEGMAAK